MPSKIQQKTLCSITNWADLKMFDIGAQISAIELTWIGRLVQDQDTDYYDLWKCNIKSPD